MNKSLSYSSPTLTILIWNSSLPLEIQVSIWYHFPSAWRNFNISGLLVTIFCLKKYISPSFILAFIFKRFSLETGFEVDSTFSLTLKMSCHLSSYCFWWDMNDFLALFFHMYCFFPPLQLLFSMLPLFLVFSNLIILEWFSLGLSYFF